MVTTSMELLPLAKSRFEHFPYINVFNLHTNAVGQALSSLSLCRCGNGDRESQELAPDHTAGG